MSTTVKGGIEGLTEFQYTVGDVQSFRIIRADDEHGGLACVGQAGSKARPQVALVTSEARRAATSLKHRRASVVSRSSSAFGARMLAINARGSSPGQSVSREFGGRFGSQ